MLDRPDNINVFILYSEADEDLKGELESHLSLLHHHGFIDIWHEGKIEAGAEKDEVMRDHIRKAHIILLLISSHFLAPDCYARYEEEMRIAYERQRKGEVRVIPVILRHCLWQFDVLAGLTPLPKNGHPVRSAHWENQDKAFQEVALGLRRAANELLRAAALHEQAEAPAPPPAPTPAPADGAERNTAAAPPLQDRRDGAARQLLGELMDVLQRHDRETSAALAVALTHHSLVHAGTLDAGFRKIGLFRAHERAHLYKKPVVILERQPTGRRKLGRRPRQEQGDEIKYVLARHEDLGGLPGHVRIFFPHDGSDPKISSLSL